MKICSACKEKKPLSEFARKAANKDGLSSHCKLCNTKRAKEWYHANKEKVKLRDTNWNRHKISEEQFNQLLLEQNGLCAICELKIPNCIDHDHACCPGSRSCGKCVRGLLCQECNKAIGLLHDSVSRLKNAIKYLS